MSADSWPTFLVSADKNFCCADCPSDLFVGRDKNGRPTVGRREQASRKGAIVNADLSMNVSADNFFVGSIFVASICRPTNRPV